MSTRFMSISATSSMSVDNAEQDFDHFNEKIGEQMSASVSSVVQFAYSDVACQTKVVYPRDPTLLWF